MSSSIKASVPGQFRNGLFERPDAPPIVYEIFDLNVFGPDTYHRSQVVDVIDNVLGSSWNSGYQGVRAGNAGKSSGEWIFEFEVSIANDATVGIDNAAESWAVGAGSSYPGEFAEGFGIRAWSTVFNLSGESNEFSGTPYLLSNIRHALKVNLSTNVLTLYNGTTTFTQNLPAGQTWYPGFSLINNPGFITIHPDLTMGVEGTANLWSDN